MIGGEIAQRISDLTPFSLEYGLLRLVLGSMKSSSFYLQPSEVATGKSQAPLSFLPSCHMKIRTFPRRTTFLKVQNTRSCTFLFSGNLAQVLSPDAVKVLYFTLLSILSELLSLVGLF